MPALGPHGREVLSLTLVDGLKPGAIASRPGVTSSRAVSAVDATITREGERQAEALRIKSALRPVR